MAESDLGIGNRRTLLNDEVKLEKAAIKHGRNKNTSADVLKTIVGRSEKVDRLVAKHPNADGAVLRGLSGTNDKTTIKYLLLNPNTPDETILGIASKCSQDCRTLLRNLFKNPDCQSLDIRLAKNKNATSDALGILMGIHTSVDRLIAKHPNAAHYGMLDQMSESKDRITRRNVLLNPNVPSTTAAMLASEFPDEFMKLPILVLNDLIIEHSECIFGIGQTLLFQILTHPQCPPLLLNWAVKRGGTYEQLAVWKNPSAPVELLTEMMVTGYQQEANVLLALPEKALEFLNGLGFVGSPPSSYEELCDYGGWLSNTSHKVDDLWEKLRPKEGDTEETVQWKMVFANDWIKGDYYKNGWGNWHQQYGLSQFLAVYLADESTFNPFAVSVLRADIRAMDSCGQMCMYQGNLEQTFLGSINDMEEIFLRLDAAIVVWCERHPEPISYNRSN